MRSVNVDASTISDMTYHGRSVKHRFRAAVTMAGLTQLELVEPLEGDTVYGDFLKEHGEGVHHVGHVKVDNLDQAIGTQDYFKYICISRLFFFLTGSCEIMKFNDE